MKKLITVGLVSILAVFYTVDRAVAYEEPNYKVLKKEKNIEIRLYEETAVAEVSQDGKRRRGSSSAFMTLFRFIGGANSKKKSIPMTVPVTRKPELVSEKIPMTVPVTQKETKDGTWTMAFYMPADMPFEEIPKPLDERVKLRKIEARKIAAIKFSGWMNGKNIEKNSEKLKSFLQKNGIEFEGPYLVASYNHPMTPPPMRRNEVLYVISSPQTSND